MIGAEDRIRGDARGVVVGEPGEQAGPQHRDERGQASAAAQAPAGVMVPARPASVQVAHADKLCPTRRLQIRLAP